MNRKCKVSKLNLGPVRRFDDVKDMFEGIVAFKIGDKWGLMNAAGHNIVPLKYDAVADFIDGMGEVKLAGNYSIAENEF
ncbi:MAG: hypothetical protein H6Q69_137 [Firmicutes bacterium]|nr:hypothetical protein [Bacillota bacterium]MBP2657105.1 hypothetical protein [Bacillota bacterium]